MKPDCYLGADDFHRSRCQWACPAHTPVPIHQLARRRRLANAHDQLEIFRTCSTGEFSEATAIVVRGPTCRRAGRGKTPVAICRLKRVAGRFHGLRSKAACLGRSAKNGKRYRDRRRGPASLTVARELAP